MSEQTVVYCHCTFANVIPAEVKNAALAEIIASGLNSQAVPDLCQMAAEGDERLGVIAAAEETTVVACYQRAVKGLFDRAGYPLKLDDDAVTVLNMREHDADGIVEQLPKPADTERRSEQETARARLTLSPHSKRTPMTPRPGSPGSP